MVVTAGNGVIFMNTNVQDMAKSRKLRNIIVTAVALIVILFVGIWAISSATKSSSNNDANKAETVKTEEKNKTPVGTTPASPSQQYTVADNKPAAATSSEGMPKTGPTEVIFSAIMLGVVVYLIGLNINLVKENR